MKRKIVSKNVFASILLQLLTLINGLIVPKIILSNFGSNVNGLVSSITQFLNYITILEGGVGAVVMSALYKPLADQDFRRVSAILKASERFFKTIAYIFSAYACIIAVIGPIFIWKEFNWSYTASLVCVLAINAFVQYYFSITYKMLLNADQKTYIVSYVQIISITLNLVMAIIVANFYPEIHLLKIVNAIAYCIQPIIFNSYVKRHYVLDKRAEADNNALKQRWDGFGQNVAYVVHMNTDVAVLTIFSNLSNVSVYSVYNLVVTALRNFVVAISSAILPSLGNVLVSGDVKKSNEAFSLYELGVGLVTTVLYSCGSILVESFVLLYTSGVEDADYSQPLFGFLIMGAIALGCIRDPFINVANAAGHFKSISKYAYAEAAINISTSILLVRKYGLIGVAIGTFVASAFRYIAQVLYLSKNILYRSILLSLKSFSCYLLIYALSNLIARTFLIYKIKNYIEWILFAFLVFALVIAVTFFIVSLFYQKIIRENIKRRK